MAPPTSTASTSASAQSNPPNRDGLNNLRKAERGKVTRVATKIREISNDVDIDRPTKIRQLKTKLNDFVIAFGKLEALDHQIYLDVDPDEMDDEIDATNVVNDVHHTTIDTARNLIDALEIEEVVAQQQVNVPLIQAANQPQVPVPQQAVSRVTSRPKIQLPRFDGDILKWMAFFQAFEAEIDSDPTIPNITKFNYLMGQLDQNVVRTVAGLTPSNDNYQALVDLLKDRYGSKPKVIMAYMRALYGLAKPENSIVSLRMFYDSLESYVRGLESLGKKSESYGDLLVCILLDKLPSELRKNMARKHDQDEWTLETLRTALRSEIRVLEVGQVPANQQQTPQQSRNNNQQHGHRTVTLVNEVKTPFCPFCDGAHWPSNCTKHQTIESRMGVVMQKKFCINCLRSNHMKTECKSQKRCFTCKKKHHSSLHDNSSSSSRSSSTNQVTTASIVSKSNKSSTERGNPVVLFKTAIAKIRSQRNVVSGNILFDEGSQRTFITKTTRNRLGVYPKSKELLTLSGLKGMSSQAKLYDVVEFSVLTNDGSAISVRAVILDLIVSPLDDSHRQEIVSLPYLQNLKLAHPKTNEDTFNVDILIGADYYWSFIGDKEPVRGSGPTAIESRVGYLLSGPLLGSKCQQTEQVTLTINAEAHDQTEVDLSKLWSLEAMGISPIIENKFEAASYAKHNIEKNQEGYVARFTWKTDHPELLSNYMAVSNMTRAAVYRVAKDKRRFSFLGELIDQQLKNGFIEKVPLNEISNPSHYIPYHFIEKDSATTPIRIVYNCSCRAKNGVSLNDCLETGAALQNDQLAIILRFRVAAIGIVTDVEKAFHHVQLNEKDRDFVRWFWLKDPSDPSSQLESYRFRVIPFGAKASPFILNATILHHLGQKSSDVARDMEKNVFVDNIITSVETVEEARHYYKEANSIMLEANLPLQTWGFSYAIVEEELKSQGLIEDSKESKILGLKWNRQEDSLSVQKVTLRPTGTRPTTMRDVLKGVASIYDPLGQYSPLSTKGKILLQDLHIEKSILDQPLSPLNAEKWSEVVSSVEDAIDQRLMTVRRSYFGSRTRVKELHVFCDASKRAYGAVSYFVSGIESSFVLSKSRITPLQNLAKGERTLTNPEAELMAAVIGVSLAESISNALEKINIKLDIHLWSDNQIVLFWISKDEGHPRQFISNRIKKIRSFNQLYGVTWHYVPTTENPADLLSRGVSFKGFKSSSSWKIGPDWLTKREEWPSWSVDNFKSTVLLTTTTVNLVKAPVSKDNLLSIINPGNYKWSTLLRMTARIFRLLENFKQLDRTRKSWRRHPLTAAEINNAEKKWIKKFQIEYFKDEIEYLRAKQKKWRPALVRQLDLFLDDQGIIRCGGRLTYAQLPESAKTPMLLPKKSTLTKQVIIAAHERTFHMGVDATMANLRQQFWIPSMRQQVKLVCRSCVKCCRDSGPSYQQPDPGPIPRERVQKSYPFFITGLDYTGAIPIRKADGTKGTAYILLMTCGTTRAIHLELVETMSTEHFLNAFRRFTGHHPLPQIIYSDNASTFTSAAGILTRLSKDPSIIHLLTNKRIEWKFIPKRAPWVGGFWERLVGITKIALRKMVGRSLLNLEDMRTIVTEAEAILNDRPLTRVSSEPGSFEGLTPSHLLYGQRLTVLPVDTIEDEELIDPSYAAQPSVLSKQYHRRQHIVDSFYKIWTTQYLPSLRQFHQSTNGNIKEKIKVGDVVQIHNEAKRTDWKLAVVEELIRSNEGVVRSAIIRTARGKTNRPIAKLYPIEVYEEPELSDPIPPIVRAADSRPTRKAAEKAKKKIRLNASKES